MEPINSLSGLAELLRKRITAEAAARRDGRATVHNAQAGPAGSAGRPDLATLRTRITDAVKAIDADAPQRQQKALHVFVENVLAWQFGSGILNDPAFADLVAEIQEAMGKDPAVAELLSQATERHSASR